MEEEKDKTEIIPAKAELKKQPSRLKSILNFLFKEPKKEGQGDVMHFIRRVGRIVFVVNLLFFVIVFSLSFIMYRLIHYSLWPEGFESAVYTYSFFIFFVSFLIWKGESSGDSRHKSIRNNHKSTNFHHHNNRSESWTTKSSYSSVAGNIYHHRRH